MPHKGMISVRRVQLSLNIFIIELMVVFGSSEAQSVTLLSLSPNNVGVMKNWGSLGVKIGNSVISTHLEYLKC